jgi:two-component SAPR family response regulator
MFTPHSANVSLDSLRSCAAGKKVVFVYPWTNYQSFLLAQFLSPSREGLLYYSIPVHITTLNHWLCDMTDAFDTVLSGFGTHLRRALDEPNPVTLAEALVADLDMLPNPPAILYVDQAERINDGDNADFFLNALMNTTSDTQIAFSSRLLSYRPWNTLLKRERTVVLGTEQRHRDLFFTVEATPKPQLEVYALGRGYALLNGEEIHSWDGMLPRNLFFYLIDHPLVTRDQIFSDFWAQVPLKDATDIFHVTKHKVTEVITRRIGISGDYEITQYTQGFYIPSNNLVVHYDAEMFERAVERAANCTDEREAELLLRSALDLYKGNFLQDSDAGWAARRREQLARQHSDAQILLGRILERRGDLEAACQHFMNALRERPEREDIHRAVIRLYLQLGRVQEAQAQYQVLDSDLYQKLGMKPSPESLQLLREIEQRL